MKTPLLGVKYLPAFTPSFLAPTNASDALCLCALVPSQPSLNGKHQHPWALEEHLDITLTHHSSSTLHWFTHWLLSHWPGLIPKSFSELMLRAWVTA